MDEREYSVSEAVRLTGIPSHVLRYWEDELKVEIRRTSQGHRVYSERNLSVFVWARDLKERGIQLRAIRTLLEQNGDGPDAGELLGRLGAAEAVPPPAVTPSPEQIPCPETTPYPSAPEIMPGPETAPPPAVTPPPERPPCPETTPYPSVPEIMPGPEAVPHPGAAPERMGGYGEEAYEIITTGSEDDDPAGQFESILRRIMWDVAEEQNERLEQTISDVIHEEAQELYVQYCRMAAREAAAAGAPVRRKNLLHRLLCRLLDRK